MSTFARQVRGLSLLMLLVLDARVVLSAGSGAVPVPPPSANPGRAPAMSAEARYNEGEARAAKHDWPGAEAAYRDATRLKPAFPEAWNGLGHALKNLKRYDESVRAYQEALRLRPDYPQALEYLG